MPVTRPERIVPLALAALLAGTLALPAPAAGPDAKDVQAVRDKAVTYFRSSQAKDGSFSAKFFGPGPTALVVAALLRNGYGPEGPVVAKALKYLETKAQKDGGIYDRRLRNYTTSVAIMAFQEANKDGKYNALIKKAAAYLKTLQNNDPSGKELALGGVGYEGKGKADLSNTQLFLEALLAAGVPKDDPAVHDALKFISRCQNLPGESNKLPFAKKAKEKDKGGLTYTPLDPDDSPHKTGDGGLRSLGAMTYAGLKSFLYAGVKKNDPRVLAAVGWVRRNYTLEENTGQGKAGLYYYYSTFGKAMDAWGEEPFKDSTGKLHDWRKELFEALQKRQQPNGSFVNKGDKTYGEQDPNLATAFALLSLSYTRGKK
jgi:squalene-hopene/tetraprenyl-beta-curcumene cyclase